MAEISQQKVKCLFLSITFKIMFNGLYEASNDGRIKNQTGPLEFNL